MEAKQFYKHCITIRKKPQERVISDEDMKKLFRQFGRDYESKPDYIPTYAVEFACMTGMRVGEIAALTWSKITDEYILVDQSEKYNRKTKEYYISITKNGMERQFPLTPEIKELLERIKKRKPGQAGFQSGSFQIRKEESMPRLYLPALKINADR